MSDVNVNDELIKKLAKLSRLKFAGEEERVIKEDLTKILDFVEKLNELDLSEVEPLLGLGTNENLFREDDAKPIPDDTRVLKEAPEQMKNYFTVPKVIDKNE